jgi:tetratricopeptide (TPR) repeat protein
LSEAESWREKGRVFVIEKNYDKAIECYEKGLENLNPNYFRDSSDESKKNMFKL